MPRPCPTCRRSDVIETIVAGDDRRYVSWACSGCGWTGPSETLVGLGALAAGMLHHPSRNKAADHAKSGPAGASGPGSTNVST